MRNNFFLHGGDHFRRLAYIVIYSRNDNSMYNEIVRVTFIEDQSGFLMVN